MLKCKKYWKVPKRDSFEKNVENNKDALAKKNAFANGQKKDKLGPSLNMAQNSGHFDDEYYIFQCKCSITVNFEKVFCHSSWYQLSTLLLSFQT